MLDKKTANQISARALELLKPLEAEFGISVARSGGSFNESNVTLKFQAATVNEDGQALTKVRADLEAYCEIRHGIKLAALDTPFTQGVRGRATEYRVVGYRPRARKMPFICERVTDGAQFTFPASTIESHYSNGAEGASLGQKLSSLTDVNLRRFIRGENETAKLYGNTRKQIDPDNLTQEDATTLYHKLDGNMSPENLHMDGEITPSAARKRAKLFTGAAADLDKMDFVRPDDLYCI